MTHDREWCRIEDDAAAYERGRSNIDPNDIAELMGLEAVARAFEHREVPDLLPALDLAALAKSRAEPVRFAIEGIAPLGEVTLFTGPGSAGKSLLAQQLATAAAAGIQCLGLDVLAGPALYVTCEDSPTQLHYRQERLCEALRVPMASLADKLHLVSLRGAIDNPLDGVDGKGNYAPSPAFHRMAATIKAAGARIVALDNVAHLFTGNENDRGEVTRFVNLLNRLAGETGAAILLIGHPNKSGDTYSGSTAWLNAVRSQVWIDKVRDGDGNTADPDARVLTVGKANYARAGEAVRFRWHEWAFVRDEDMPRDVRAELADVIAANGANAAFMRCLDVRNEQERPVSDSPASRTFAPKEFAAMPEAKGITRADLDAAMDRLFRTGEIEIGLVCRTGRKDRFGIRRKRADGAPTGCADLRADPAPTPRRPAPSHTPSSKLLPGAGPEGPPPLDDDDLDWGDGEPDECL